MSQNIWEIVTVTDLIKILKEHEQKFVIIAITLQNTPQETVKMLKKFLKDYSKKYKNITFLYFNVADKDLGRISLLNKDKSEYPFLYHVYDVKNIFVSVNRVNKNTLYESMYAVEKYYQQNEYNINNNITINNQNGNGNNNGNNNDNNDNNNDDNNNDNNNDNNDNNNDNNDENNMLLNDEETQRKVIEHEKLLNRIYLFEEKKKKHNREFLEDIQKRKKEEKNK
jgi:hypothetical protein